MSQTTTVGESDVIEAVQNIHAEYDEVSGQLIQNRSDVSPSHVYQFFDGMADACEEAGIPYEDNRGRPGKSSYKDELDDMLNAANTDADAQNHVYVIEVLVDGETYTYVGRASNLRVRMCQHINDNHMVVKVPQDGRFRKEPYTMTGIIEMVPIYGDTERAHYVERQKYDEYVRNARDPTNILGGH